MDVKCSASGTLSTIGSSCWMADAAEKPPDPIIQIHLVIIHLIIILHNFFERSYDRA